MVGGGGIYADAVKILPSHPYMPSGSGLRRTAERSPCKLAARWPRRTAKSTSRRREPTSARRRSQPLVWHSPLPLPLLLFLYLSPPPPLTTAMGGAELGPPAFLRGVAVAGTAAAVVLYLAYHPPPPAGAPPHVFSGVRKGGWWGRGHWARGGGRGEGGAGGRWQETTPSLMRNGELTRHPCSLSRLVLCVDGRATRRRAALSAGAFLPFHVLSGFLALHGLCSCSSCCHGCGCRPSRRRRRRRRRQHRRRRRHRRPHRRRRRQCKETRHGCWSAAPPPTAFHARPSPLFPSAASSGQASGRCRPVPPFPLVTPPPPFPPPRAPQSAFNRASCGSVPWPPLPP